MVLKKRTLRLVGSAATMVMAALLIAGCGSGSNTVAQAARDSGKATGTLAIGMSAAAAPEFTWWPPIVSANACDTVTGGGAAGPDMYMPLLWFGSNGNIAYSHSLASSVSVSTNDQTFTVQLNHKWHWSNGTPVTAQDVVFDWQLIAAATSGKSHLPYCFTGTGGVPKDWASVVAAGPETVKITTTKAVNPTWFEHNGLSQLVPVPKPEWDKYPNNIQKTLSWIVSIADHPTNPVYKVVDGPYDVYRVKTDQYWEYVANPHYDGLTKPSIKYLMYEDETSSAATFAQLRTGVLGLAYPSFSELDPAKALHGYRVVAKPTFSFAYMALNLRSNANGIGGLFNQLYVRQALQYGVNQKEIIADIYHGLATPTYDPVPSEPQNSFYNYGFKSPYTYNPTKGEKLLEAHGWHKVNGVMTRGGKQLAFNVMFETGSNSQTDMVQYMQRTWAKEGIKVTLDPVSQTTLFGTVPVAADSSKWAIGGWWDWSYYPDYYPSGGDFFLPGAGSNYGDYVNPPMIHLVQLTYEGGPAALVKSRFDAYQKYAALQLPFLYVPTPDRLAVVSDSVHGYVRNFNSILGYAPMNHLTLSH